MHRDATLRHCLLSLLRRSPGWVEQLADDIELDFRGLGCYVVDLAVCVSKVRDCARDWG